ncbi:MAG: zinc-ribbon domain-containing protein [Candidatus Thorarchaeota archaeon]
MFCPQCGSNLSDEADFCPNCGEELVKVKHLLEESSNLSGISEPKPDLELLLEGDDEVIYYTPHKVKKFFLTVKNNNDYPINNIIIKITGPPSVDLLTNLVNIQSLESKSTNSAPIAIFPKESGVFTVIAQLQSALDHYITLTITIRTEDHFSLIERGNVSSSYTRKPHTAVRSEGVDQGVVILIICAIIGIVCMIAGIGVFLSGGFSVGLTTGISLLVIGVVCLGIGTKGRCCAAPFYCACDDCDC